MQRTPMRTGQSSPFRSRLRNGSEGATKREGRFGTRRSSPSEAGLRIVFDGVSA
jgi:hypothetical protein